MHAVLIKTLHSDVDDSCDDEYEDRIEKIEKQTWRRHARKQIYKVRLRR